MSSKLGKERRQRLKSSLAVARHRCTDRLHLIAEELDRILQSEGLAGATCLLLASNQDV